MVSNEKIIKSILSMETLERDLRKPRVVINFICSTVDS